MKLVRTLNLKNILCIFCALGSLKERLLYSVDTAVKPGIYGLAFTIGKWVLTDNSATVGWILMISSADPHEILILVEG